MWVEVVTLTMETTMAVATAMKAPIKNPVKTGVKTTRKTVVKIKPALAHMEDVANFICSYSGWGLGQLELQKILYLAQMIHLGRHEGVPLFDEDFEAWQYGPIIPELYHMVKHLGSGVIPRYTFRNAGPIKHNKPLAEFLEEMGEGLVPMQGWELLHHTHGKLGAWVKYYEDGVRGIVIPKQAMLDEYEARFGE